MIPEVFSKSSTNAPPSFPVPSYALSAATRESQDILLFRGFHCRRRRLLFLLGGRIFGAIKRLGQWAGTKVGQGLMQVDRIALLSDKYFLHEVPRMNVSLNFEGSVTAYSRIHCRGIVGEVIGATC